LLLLLLLLLLEDVAVPLMWTDGGMETVTFDESGGVDNTEEGALVGKVVMIIVEVTLGRALLSCGVVVGLTVNGDDDDIPDAQVSMP